MSTMLSGSMSAFGIAMETGSTYYSMQTGDYYRFDTYRFLKSMGFPCAGVPIEDGSGEVVGLWNEEDVQKYIKDNNLKLDY